MAQSAEEWFAQLCTEAGFDEATTNALTAAAKNDKFSSAVNTTLRRATDDFNAMQGRVTAADKKVKELSDYGNQAFQANKQLIDELAALRNSGSNPNGGFDLSQFLTKADIAKLNEERDNRYSAVIKDGLRLASRHAVQYGEELNVDELETYAREQNLPLALAYDKWVQPRVEAKRAAEAAKEKQSWEEKLKQAREEGARDYASKHKLPVDTAPSFRSAIHHSPAADSIPKDMDGELLAAWNGTG